MTPEHRRRSCQPAAPDRRRVAALEARATELDRRLEATERLVAERARLLGLLERFEATPDDRERH